MLDFLLYPFAVAFLLFASALASLPPAVSFGASLAVWVEAWRHYRRWVVIGGQRVKRSAGWAKVLILGVIAWPWAAWRPTRWLIVHLWRWDVMPRARYVKARLRARKEVDATPAELLAAAALKALPPPPAAAAPGPPPVVYAEARPRPTLPFTEDEVLVRVADGVHKSSWNSIPVDEFEALG